VNINEALQDRRTNRSTQQTEFSEFFAPERYLHTKDISKALEASSAAFRYHRHEIALAQFFLDDDFTLTFNGNRFRLTEKGFEDLCKIVKVPVNFAKIIPADLVVSIIERLKFLHQQTVVPISRDDVIVGIVDPMKWTHSRAKVRRPQYLPITAPQILHLIEKVCKDRDDPLSITIADSGLLIEVTDSSLLIEPKPGDVTQIGFAITASETGGPMPQARGYTLRLICSNGATVPEIFGLIRFNTDWRVNLNRRLEAFGAGLQTFALDIDCLRNVYMRITTEPVTDHLFYSLYRQARYIYRNTPHQEHLVDKALGVRQEQRQQLVSHVRRHQADLRSVSTAPIEPPQATNLLAWDIFNSITAMAREETYQRRVSLEDLASDVFRAYMPQNLN